MPLFVVAGASSNSYPGLSSRDDARDAHIAGVLWDMSPADVVWLISCLTADHETGEARKLIQSGREAAMQSHDTREISAPILVVGERIAGMRAAEENHIAVKPSAIFGLSSGDLERMSNKCGIVLREVSCGCHLINVKPVENRSQHHIGSQSGHATQFIGHPRGH